MKRIEAVISDEIEPLCREEATIMHQYLVEIFIVTKRKQNMFEPAIGLVRAIPYGVDFVLRVRVELEKLMEDHGVLELTAHRKKVSPTVAHCSCPPNSGKARTLPKSWMSPTNRDSLALILPQSGRREQSGEVVDQDHSRQQPDPVFPKLPALSCDLYRIAHSVARVVG